MNCRWIIGLPGHLVQCFPLATTEREEWLSGNSGQFQAGVMKPQFDEKSYFVHTAGLWESRDRDQGSQGPVADEQSGICKQTEDPCLLPGIAHFPWKYKAWVGSVSISRRVWCWSGGGGRKRWMLSAEHHEQTLLHLKEMWTLSFINVSITGALFVKMWPLTRTVLDWTVGRLWGRRLLPAGTAMCPRCWQHFWFIWKGDSDFLPQKEKKSLKDDCAHSLYSVSVLFHSI